MGLLGRRTKTVAIGALLTAFAAPLAGASERDDLIASIIKSGTFLFPTERYTTEIEGCQMTSNHWKAQADGSWLLWGGITFDMTETIFTSAVASGEKLFIALNRGSPENPEMVAIITYRMRDGQTARQERSVLRPTIEKTEPSPRGDGTSHYYQKSTRFMMMRKGPEALTKTERFTKDYRTYVERYCTFVS